LIVAYFEFYMNKDNIFQHRINAYSFLNKKNLKHFLE
jgi:hypothetical protein